MSYWYLQRSSGSVISIVVSMHFFVLTFWNFITSNFQSFQQKGNIVKLKKCCNGNRFVAQVVPLSHRVRTVLQAHTVILRGRVK